MLANLVLVLIVAHGAYGKHFRGGSMKWEPNDNGSQVEVTYYLDYTFRHNNKGYCTEAAWSSQSIIQTDRQLTCNGCQYDETVRTLEWYCTDYDESENWASGFYTMTYNVPEGTTRLTIVYNDCCWVRVVSPNTGGRYDYSNLLTEVNLIRHPKGGFNKSPVVAPIAFENYYRGNVYYLHLAVSDPDGDHYRCRYFKMDECADSRTCGVDTSGLTVHPNCTLVFNTVNVASGNHAVNIMIEDCRDEACRDPYSKVPLLFLLHVTDEEGVPPKIMPKDPCHTLRLGELFELEVVAEATDASKPISKIVTYNKPFGMEVSDMVPVPGHSDLRTSVTLSWTPNKLGQYSVCYSARDSEDYTSGMTCTFLYVVDTPLEADPANSYPSANSNTMKDYDTVIITFNQEIQRPTKSALIKILDKLENIEFSIDATNSSVNFYEQEFRIPTSTTFLTADANYTLQLDSGVAMPMSGEGCGSVATSWPFQAQAGQVIKPPLPPTKVPPTPGPGPICKEKTVSIPVPYGKEGDECFIHLKEGNVLRLGPKRILTTTMYICCPGVCAPIESFPPATINFVGE